MRFSRRYPYNSIVKLIDITINPRYQLEGLVVNCNLVFYLVGCYHLADVGLLFEKLIAHLDNKTKTKKYMYMYML